MANLISISLEATKIKEEEFVDKFISNVNLDFCTLEKIHKKSDKSFAKFLKTSLKNLIFLDDFFLLFYHIYIAL